MLASLGANPFSPVAHAGESVVLLNLSPSLESVSDAALSIESATDCRVPIGAGDECTCRFD